MQVYKITPTTEYSYGCAIVAANNREEAIKTFRDDDDYNDMLYDDAKCVCNIIDKLDYDCSEPTVIVDTIDEE
jgi:hypothetical protein